MKHPEFIRPISGSSLRSRQARFFTLNGALLPYFADDPGTGLDPQTADFGPFKVATFRLKYPTRLKISATLDDVQLPSSGLHEEEP